MTMTHTRTASLPPPLPTVPPPRAASDAPSTLTRAAWQRALLLRDGSAALEWERVRALASAGTDDAAGVVPPGRVGEVQGLVGMNRPFCSAVGVDVLPEIGMQVTFARLSQRPLVAPQVQNTPPVSQPVEFDEIRVNVVTLAGGQEISNQLFLRSDPSYYASAFEAYVEEYGKACDVYLTGVVFPAVTQSVTVAADTADGWLDALAEAAELVVNSDSGAWPDLLVTSPAQWRAVAPLTTGIQSRDALTPWVGPGDPRVDVGTATIGGLRWVVCPAFADDQALLLSSRAVKFIEEAGAPFPTKASRPATNSSAMSVYGFVAAAVGDPAACCRIVPPAPAARTRPAKA